MRENCLYDALSLIRLSVPNRKECGNMLTDDMDDFAVKYISSYQEPMTSEARSMGSTPITRSMPAVR